MRVLGLDYGEKRIGLAVSDPDGIIATPAGTLQRRGLKRDLEALQALIAEREIGSVVVGLPIHLSGRAGPAAQAARAFAQRLGKAVGLSVVLFDERLTTVAAERALREGRLRGAERRGVVDSVAATLLLRSYLEQRRRGAAETPA